MEKEWIEKNWAIRELTPIYENSKRAVYRGKSERWGCIILKRNSNSGSLDREYHALSAMCDRGMCQVYGYEPERNLLLLEEIIPGTRLREEADWKKRLDGFFCVFDRLHQSTDQQENPILEGRDNQFPCASYLDWLKEEVEFCEGHPVPETVRSDIRRAYLTGQAMFEKYRDRVLLHGDLHHDNILLEASGGYRVIDPKGVVGPAVFDLPRYLLNEVDQAEDCPELICEIAGEMGEYLKIPKEDVLQLLYMEEALENAWCVEDGEEPSVYVEYG